MGSIKATATLRTAVRPVANQGTASATVAGREGTAVPPAGSRRSRPPHSTSPDHLRTICESRTPIHFCHYALKRMWPEPANPGNSPPDLAEYAWTNALPAFPARPPLIRRNHRVTVASVVNDSRHTAEGGEEVVHTAFLRLDRPELRGTTLVIRAVAPAVREQRRLSPGAPLGYLYERVDTDAPSSDLALSAGHYDEMNLVWSFSGEITGMPGLTVPTSPHAGTTSRTEEEEGPQ